MLENPRIQTDEVTRSRDQRLRLLLDAGELFAASLDYMDTTKTVARQCIGTFADFCVVHLWEGSQLKRAEIAHVSPEKEVSFREMIRRYPMPMSLEFFFPNVLRTGCSELIVELTEDHLKRMALDAGNFRMLVELGMRSTICVPMQSRGRILGSIVFGTIRSESARAYDVSDLRFAEQIALRAATAIDNARLYKEAQEAIAVRDDLLAVVSHDLKNPLTGILNCAEFLLKISEGRFQDEKRLERGLLTIQHAAQRMNHLISGLLSLAKARASFSQGTYLPLDCAALLTEVRTLLQPVATSKKITLRIDCPGESLAVSADKEQILRVFSNVVGNAIKFSPVGAEILIRAECHGEMARFSVHDHGPGIPPEQLPRVFERFWQAGPTASLGTGLGLSIAQGIIHSHGGKIWAESAPGIGSTFFFTLRQASVRAA